MTYEFTCSKEHMSESFQRYLMSRKLQKWWLAFKVITVIALLPLIGFCFTTSLWVAGLFLLALWLVIVFSRSIDLWIYRRQFHKSPFWDKQLVIELTDDGYHSTSVNGQAQLNWCSFTAVRQFDDGLLLFMGSRAFIWLAHREKTSGDLHEIQGLLRTKISNYQVVHCPVKGAP